MTDINGELLGIVLGIVIVICILYRVFKNPFEYPYFRYDFNVSNKRNVDIMDYVDKFLCNQYNWQGIIAHKRIIDSWKEESKMIVNRSRLKHLREEQYHSVVDDMNAFQFYTLREQTRYKQKNYVKQAYKTVVNDGKIFLDWQTLQERHSQLAEINFEATMNEYHSKNQRKLMTKKLRKQIMIRDNYTCQICGKYMPDEVGLHIDHIIPIVAGGKTVPSNLQVLCSKCNGSKGKKY